VCLVFNLPVVSNVYQASGFGKVKEKKMNDEVLFGSVGYASCMYGRDKDGHEL
jgi:hypothetical protein